MKSRRLYPGRLFDSDPEAMARGQRKIRARARHWRLLGRMRRRPVAVESGIVYYPSRRASTFNRRRRRHGMRAR